MVFHSKTQVESNVLILMIIGIHGTTDTLMKGFYKCELLNIYKKEISLRSFLTQVYILRGKNISLASDYIR